jgi:hypothetical protein
MLRAHCLPAITGKGKGASGDGTLEITGDALAPGFPRRRSYYQRTLPIASHAWQKKTQNAHSDCKVIRSLMHEKNSQIGRVGSCGRRTRKQTHRYTQFNVYTHRKIFSCVLHIFHEIRRLSRLHTRVYSSDPSAPETRQHIARARDLVEELTSRCELPIIVSTGVAATTAAPLHSTRCGRSRSQSFAVMRTF